jgi:hypothetical protein
MEWMAGLSLAEIIERTQTRGLRDWTKTKDRASATASAHSTISRDGGFVRLAPGVFALTCLAQPAAATGAARAAAASSTSSVLLRRSASDAAMHDELVGGSRRTL